MHNRIWADYNANLKVRQAKARKESEVANLDAEIIIQKKMQTKNLKCKLLVMLFC